MQIISNITCYKTVPKTAEYEGKLKKRGGSQASWNDPDTFSSGQEIARFNRAANLFFSVGITSFDIFSLDLLFSQDFTINGQEVNLGKIVPHGVTSNNTGSTISVGGPGNTLAFPFVATGIAIGNDAKSSDEY